jgi:hypothetical protein
MRKEAAAEGDALGDGLAGCQAEEPYTMSQDRDSQAAAWDG